MKKSLSQLNKEFNALSLIEQNEINEAIAKGDYSILDKKPILKELLIRFIEIVIWLPITGKGVDMGLSLLLLLFKGSEEFKHKFKH